MELRQEVLGLLERCVSLRRRLHQIPETGDEEIDTQRFVLERLEACRPDRLETLAGTGVRAVFFAPEAKETIAFRADMDALPIREENHLPFRSSGTCSHMCGHDSHAAMLLGAARILKSHENQLPGTVKLMFQPGEETGAGARLMVEAGVLEHPRPQAAFALHVQSVEETGTACCAFGVNSASLDTFILKIRGRGGHSSQPQLCVDPLIILNQVYGAVNLLAAREADPASMVTLTCGVAKGGTAVNIIPDEAELHIGLRTLDPAAAAHLTRRIPELIHHYVKAWGGEYELTAFHTPCTSSDPELCSRLLPHVREITGPERVKKIPPMTGTEDFGYVTEQIPGMFLFLGAGKPGNAPLHSPRMVLDESVLPIGAAIYANLALQWLCDMEKREGGDQ